MIYLVHGVLPEDVQKAETGFTHVLELCLEDFKLLLASQDYASIFASQEGADFLANLLQMEVKAEKSPIKATEKDVFLLANRGEDGQYRLSAVAQFPPAIRYEWEDGSSMIYNGNESHNEYVAITNSYGRDHTARIVDARSE